MGKKKVTEMVEDVLSDFLIENGYELYNTEYVKEGKDWFLRVYIDRPEEKEALGIGTDDCELVSRYLSDKLDSMDPIEQNYYLEVSSPGMDRVLLRDKDFKRYTGKAVVVNLYSAFQGKKIISGTLLGRTDKMLSIRDEDGNDLMIPTEQVAKTRLEVII